MKKPNIMELFKDAPIALEPDTMPEGNSTDTENSLITDCEETTGVQVVVEPIVPPVLYTHLQKIQASPINNIPEDIQEPTTEKKEESIQLIPVELMVNYSNHPFKPYTEEKLVVLRESIRVHGILSPLRLRPLNGAYEILSGHNRRTAGKAEGLSELPCIVKNADDNEAALIVAESNLIQRETLLPSERAFAYKMQMEALKNMGKNTEKFESDSDSDAKISNHYPLDKNEGIASIYRYIKLTNLLSTILLLIDDGVLSIRAGIEISYLSPTEQEEVHEYFFEDKKGTLDVKTAQLIRTRSSEVDITYQELDKLLRKAAKVTVPKSYTVPFKKVEQYLPVGTKKKEAEQIIVEALKFYYENKQLIQSETNIEMAVPDVE